MSDGASQILYTLCLQTRDAIDCSRPGCFVFRPPGDMPRKKAIKVSLGSLEFPMTQWSVEQSRNRVYVNEGHRIQREWSTLELRIRSSYDGPRDDDEKGGEDDDDDSVEDASVSLPLHLNPIVKWSRDTSSSQYVVTCMHPHGLFSPSGSCVLTDAQLESARLIATPFGCVSMESIAYVSDTSFTVPAPRGANPLTAGMTSAPRAGYVHVPCLQNPTSLARAITRACHGLRNGDLSIAFTYDAPRNEMRVAVRSHRGRHDVRFECTRLSTLLGLGSGAPRDVTVDASAPPPSGEGWMMASSTTSSSREVATEPVSWWHPVSLTPGWYTPAQRTMCTGPPLRMPDELELALNRLYFPVPESIEEGGMTAYFLIFADPCGRTFRVPVPTGMYTPHALCALLADEMTRLAAPSTPGVSFSVDYDDATRRVCFACEVRSSRDGKVRAAPFSLHFGHPLQFHPRRIGFETHSYTGSSSYTAPNECLVLNMHPPRDGGGGGVSTEYDVPQSNLYRVVEVGHQKRFRVHSTPLPHPVGIVERYDEAESVLVVRTYVGNLPYSHGLAPSDVVGVYAVTRPVAVLASDEAGVWTERPVTACPLAASYERLCVVLPPENGASVDTTVARLRVPSTPELADCVGTAVQLQRSVQPFNLCMGTLPRSLAPHALGFPPGATQHGVDGSVHDRRLGRVPPFDAPRVHDLDHPDYILMYLDEGKRGTLLQHANAGSTTTPLAKIVLYPNLREERMLPRDTSLLSGESLSTFSVRFANSDGTPYEFHGAEFSFSLNLLSADV